MGRQLKQKDNDIEFQKHHPSSMSGLLHILDYHHNRNTGKKDLHCRKHGKGKVATSCEDPKKDSLDNCTDQLQQHLHSDDVPLLVGQDFAEATSTKRTSANAQTKALVAEGMSGRLGLQALELSRQEGSSRYDLTGTKPDWGNPFVVLQRTADLPVPSSQEILQQRLSSEKTRACTQYAQSSNGEISRSQLKDCVDVLEMLQVNKKLFLEILHDQKLPVPQTLIRQGRLKKSDSFPVAKPSYKRFIRPITLEHKQKEIWSFAKVEKANSVVQSPKFFAPECTKNTAISKPVEVKDTESGYASDTQEPSFHSPALSRSSRKQWWHPSIKSYFARIKMKVKHAFKHNQKENGIPIEVSSESRPSNYEKDESLEGIKSSSNDLGKIPLSLPQIKRASSLSESMDRYTQLFEHSFSNRAPRHQYHSRSLILTTEDRSLSTGYSLKTFRRRYSLPDFNSLLPFLDEALNDHLKSEFQKRAVASRDTNAAPESVNASAEVPEHPECKRYVELRGDSSENDGNSGDLLTNVDENTAVAIDPPEELAEQHQEEQLASTINSILSPVSVLETRFQDDISGQPDFPASKGSEVDACSVSAQEPDDSTSLRQSLFKDSTPECNPERAAKATSTANTQFLGSNLNKQYDPALDYVRDVLQISGFLDQDCQPTWYSLDQPLSPNLFKELEIYLQPKQKYHHEDFSYENDHQLLFDLVNDSLLELFESSLAYFPKQFSFARSVHRAPEGNRVLKEVWKRVSWHQSSGSRKDQSLNDIVAREMAKGDHRINVLLDVEDVALDMEEIIFDELLDEVLELLDYCV